MIKFVDAKIVFQEVPDEITLAISISGCTIGCKDCHSPHLAEDRGTELTTEELKRLLRLNWGVTCVCFMGGDNSPEDINYLAYTVRDLYPELKVAWYSGKNEWPSCINLDYFDFIKVGPYIKNKGPLHKRTTNQTMYEIIHLIGDDGPENDYVDITWKFWRKK